MKIRSIRKLLVISCTIFLSCSAPSKKEPAATETKTQKETLNNTNGVAMNSEITCPACGHKKTETMPTEICLLRYTCENCKKEMFAKESDCCVFCSYGTNKCPSMQ